MSQKDVFIHTNKLHDFIVYLRNLFKTESVFYQEENKVFKVIVTDGTYRIFEVLFYRDGIGTLSPMLVLTDEAYIALVTIAERCIMTQ